MKRTERQPSGEQPVPLSIGLVNNASDRALHATEAQFIRVLQAASGGFDLTFRLFTTPQIARFTPPLDRSGKAYADIGDLLGSQLDALIVTGMEPQAKTLPDEPVWDNITRLVDWAADNSVPVIWSCLAAHAAVLYLDGISRVRLPGKLSGIFGCDVLPSGHMLTSELPSRWSSPHSRYHDLSRAALVASDYQILSWSDEAGVDVFLKQQETTSLFFQGHPEYDADTVARQYARDVRRYLVGENNEYPLIPRHIFDPSTEAALADARDRASRSDGGLHDFAAVVSLIRGAATNSPWEQPAIALYANWLKLVAQQRRHTAWVTPGRFAQPHDATLGGQDALAQIVGA